MWRQLIIIRVLLLEGVPTIPARGGLLRRYDVPPPHGPDRGESQLFDRALKAHWVYRVKRVLSICLVVAQLHTKRANHTETGGGGQDIAYNSY